MAERRLVPLLLLGALAGAARAERPATPALDGERDRLLDQITRGVDYEASVRRFAELVRQRDAIVATSERARADERAAADARRAWQEQYHKTADHEVGWRCTLSPDPAHPLPSREGRFRPDWGQVLRKQTVRLPPRNELDPGEEVTLYEVGGRAQRWVFRGDRFDPFRKPFRAEEGDLVLVCSGGEDLDRALPPGWGERAVRSGFAVRLARPPLIADKAAFAPIHITDAAFFWAIHDVRWPWAGQHVLSNVEIGRDLGGGRFEVPTSNGKTWVMEVPPSLRHRELVVPGRSVWVILGDHRFDRTLGTLVLVAKDVEATYVFEKPSRP